VLVTPLEGQPGLDGDEVVLQPTGEARQLCDPAGDRFRHPGLQVSTPALPNHGEKALGQPMRPRDPGVHLTELVQIRLGLA
jgi:hypothetical protein